MSPSASSSLKDLAVILSSYEIVLPSLLILIRGDRDERHGFLPHVIKEAGRAQVLGCGGWSSSPMVHVSSAVFTRESRVLLSFAKAMLKFCENSQT